jgi:hypothetical protein
MSDIRGVCTKKLLLAKKGGNTMHRYILSSQELQYIYDPRTSNIYPLEALPPLQKAQRPNPKSLTGG